MTVPAQHYNTSLEGVRAVAACGVMVTHVAFQTGLDPAGFFGSIAARFDFFVAVFFALSAFLLWRGIDRYRGRWAAYYRNRAGRILPAYLVCVVAVILLLPDASNMSATQIISNLTLTQIYVADGLAPGLTHLWSLAVEVAFYLVLPVLAMALAPLGKKGRVIVIVLLAVLSLGWAYLPFVEATPAEGVANRQIWPPAYTAWFAVGLLAAEFEHDVPPRAQRVLHHRWVFWLLALVVAWVAGQEFFGPLGLEHPAPGEFVRRVLAGTVFAATVMLPYALAPRQDAMTSAPMQFLGRISYSIFLWHVAVLAIAFPLTGISLFQGGFWIILAVTVAITVPVVAASYYFVEEPARRWVRSRSATRQANAAAQTPAISPSSPA